MKNFKDLNPNVQQTILNQYEQIRKFGKFNMFDFYSVQREAFDLGFYEFVNFTENILKNYLQILHAYSEYVNNGGNFNDN